MEFVQTDAAPGAVGPYSQAVKAGGFVFTAGQVGLDPATGKLVGGGVEAETKRVMANLAAVLEAAGSGLDRVVKTTIFLADIADFQAVNAVYAAALGDHRPARSTVQAGALPLGARVEIEAVALV
jgi:2-iminobutanoate/2-iminopropanoate deaminase